MPDGQDVLASLLYASGRTWRLSDGRGALSRGTASGAATRRGHALLAAPQVGPRADLPAVSLLHFDDRVTPDGGPPFELTPAFVLASRGDAAPQLSVRAGLLPALESFREQPWPRWRFRGDGWLIEREYRLIEGHAALLATWRLLEGGPLRLHVAPLLVARPLAGLQTETPEFRGAVTGIPGRVRCVTVEGYAAVTLWHGGAFMPARAWQRGLAYPFDDAFDPRDPDAGAVTASEDAFLPGWIQMRARRTRRDAARRRIAGGTSVPRARHRVAPRRAARTHARRLSQRARPGRGRAARRVVHGRARWCGADRAARRGRARQQARQDRHR